MPSVRKLKLEHNWTFQQDNDHKHTTKSIKVWFQKKSWKNTMSCDSHLTGTYRKSFVGVMGFNKITPKKIGKNNNGPGQCLVPIYCAHPKSEKHTVHYMSTV